MVKKESLSERGLDWVTFSLYLSLMAIGWLMIYAVGHKHSGYTQDMSEFLLKTQVGKQTIFIGVSLLMMVFIFVMDWKIWRVLAFVFYGLGIILLILVLFLGSDINGARAWFSFGFFSFQPAEIAKFGTCLALSSHLSSANTSLSDRKTVLQAIGIIALPVFFIFLQPDAGSALVFFSFYFMLYREGASSIPFVIGLIMLLLFIVALIFESTTVILGLMLLGTAILAYNLKANKLYLVGGIIAWIAFSVIGFHFGFIKTILIINLLALITLELLQWRNNKANLVMIMLVALSICSAFTFSTNYVFYNVLKHHQQLRILVWLTPEKTDPQGPAYNLIHSKMAIGSGGLDGKGFLEGTMTKLNYVPEQSTDFIFCTVGEEQGFIGTFAIISLFMVLLFRITTIAERQKSNFTRHYAYGVAGIIFTHFLINIGMTMGVLPIIGIPLPFISAGGSSLMGFSLLLGVLLKMDSHRYSV